MDIYAYQYNGHPGPFRFRHMSIQMVIFIDLILIMMYAFNIRTL